MSDPVAKALVAVSRICQSLSTEDRIEVLEGLARIYRRDSSRPMPAAAPVAEVSAEEARRMKERERKKAAYRAEKLRGESGDSAGETSGVSAEKSPSPSLHSPSPSGSSLSNSEANPREMDPNGTARAAACEGSALPAPVVHAGDPKDLIEARDAYCEAISRARGQRWGFPSAREQHEAFVEALRSHARDDDGPYDAQTRLKWIRHEAPQFALFVRAKKRAGGDEAQFWSETPKCFLRWLNEQPLRDERAGTMRVAPAVADLAAGIGNGGVG